MQNHNFKKPSDIQASSHQAAITQASTAHNSGNHAGCTHNSDTKAPALFRFSSDLLSREEAANYLGVSKQTLAIWKTTGRYSLPVVKIGRLAKYRKADLDAFIARRVQGQ